MIKKILSCILIFLMISSSIGCQQNKNNTNYSFYYPRSDYGYNSLEGKFYSSFIEPEVREDISGQTVAEIINIYLTGPAESTLANPFPEKMSLESVVIEDQTLIITVSNQLSELTGIHLMIACACIAKTGMDLTNTSTVQISCKTALLDGKKFIILRNNTILFDDSSDELINN